MRAQCSLEETQMLKRHYGIIVFMSWLVVTAGIFPGADEVKTPTPRLPLLDGGFWQVGPGLSAHFSDEMLTEEVGYFKELGLSIIMIQYSGRWDPEKNQYFAYMPNPIFPIQPGLEGKDPIGAIMKAAEEHGVKVIIGGLLSPTPRHIDYENKINVWVSDSVFAYRKFVLERFQNSPALYGFYIPNEPNPQDFLDHNCDKQLYIDATKKVAEFVKKNNPKLKIVKSVGLYLEREVQGDKATYKHASVAFLDAWWRPWVEQLDAIDAWMIIDGVGTALSSLEHTDISQEWLAKLCGEHGKEFWADVENAVMGAQSYPFTMERFEKSLRVAAQRADVIVTFDYAHYMSRQSNKEAARQLYSDYKAYRAKILGDDSSPQPQANSR